MSVFRLSNSDNDSVNCVTACGSVTFPGAGTRRVEEETVEEDLRVGAVVIDCNDLRTMSRFWQTEL
jgi:hypothetical protein